MNFCTLASGSNGNSSVIINDARHILIDAGVSNRALCTSLQGIGVNHEDVGAVLITHEHTDHIKGLLMFLKKHAKVSCFASILTAQAIIEQCPELSGRIESFKIGDGFDVCGTNIETIKTPHDTPESVAYYIKQNDKKLLYATDLGYIPEEIDVKLDNLDLLMIESNYDDDKLEFGPYPAFLKARIRGDRGHLSNESCAKVSLDAVRRGSKKIVLSHLSQENNTPRLAYDAVHRALMSGGFIPGVDVDLKVAPRGMCGEVIKL